MTTLFDPPGELPFPTTPPPRRLGVDMFHAQISPQDPMSGLRGWKIYVALPGPASDWPEHVWSRQGVRPPTIEQRNAALFHLGYVPVDERARWEWLEKTDSSGRVALFATLYVKQLGAE